MWIQGGRQGDGGLRGRSAASGGAASADGGSTSARRYAHVPPFAQRRAGGFVPRTQRDFGGGGAYPEIHVSQFPRDMGRPAYRRAQMQSKGLASANVGAASQTALALRAQDGTVRGHSTFKDLVQRDTGAMRAKSGTGYIERPSAEDEAKTTDATRAALERITQARIAIARPVQVPGTGGGGSEQSGDKGAASERGREAVGGGHRSSPRSRRFAQR